MRGKQIIFIITILRIVPRGMNPTKKSQYFFCFVYVHFSGVPLPRTTKKEEKETCKQFTENLISSDILDTLPAAILMLWAFLYSV